MPQIADQKVVDRNKAVPEANPFFASYHAIITDPIINTVIQAIRMYPIVIVLTKVLQV